MRAMHALWKDVTEEEVQTLFQLSPLKAPGPNGMHAIFLKIVGNGKNISRKVQNFVNKGDMLKDLNRTYIS